MAGVEAVRKGRKRAFDNVGIVLASQDRLRIEAYGPLGQSLLTLVWDGREVLLRLPGQDRVVRPGAAGLERLFGAGLDVQELCSALAGNVPPVPVSAAVSAACGRGDLCELTIRQGDLVRRVQVVNHPSGSGQVLTPVMLRTVPQREARVSGAVRTGCGERALPHAGDGHHREP